MQTYYRIYAKFKGDNQFKAVDTNTGRTVGNLIYASIIASESLDKAIEHYKKIDKSFALIQARNVETNNIIKINY